MSAKKKLSEIDEQNKSKLFDRKNLDFLSGNFFPYATRGQSFCVVNS